MTKKENNLIVLLTALVVCVAFGFLFERKGWPITEILIQCFGYAIVVFILGWNNERFIKNNKRFDVKEDDKKIRLKFLVVFIAVFSMALFNQGASEGCCLKIIGGVALLGSAVFLRVIDGHK